MNRTRIVEVRRFELLEDRLAGFSIDIPVANECAEGFWARVAGWVVGRHQPVREIRVSIPEVGRPVQRLAANLPRPDVQAYLPSHAHAMHSGFDGHFSTFGLAPHFEVVVEVVDAEQRVIPVATICGTREGNPVWKAEPGQLQPILVTALARSGTTWLMRLLSVHPAIVVYAQYPYEMHAAGYWWQVCRVLTAPSGGIDIGHPDYFWFYLDRVGPPPFSIPDMLSEPGLAHWFRAQHVGRVLAHTSSMIEAFYRHIAASQQKQAVSHFAEKQAIPAYSWLVWELYPGAREIFLVRDFRDLYCSIVAFNRKRGVIAFERDNFDSDEAYARWLSECAVVLQRNWEARADRALLVRYEDLITAPQPEIARVLNYLGLDSRPGIVSMMLAQANMPDVNLQKHRTVDDAMQSIGRWRRELSPALQAVVNDAFRDSLRAFGYGV